jgi:hypothetical protein
MNRLYISLFDDLERINETEKVRTKSCVGSNELGRRFWIPSMCAITREQSSVLSCFEVAFFFTDYLKWIPKMFWHPIMTKYDQGEAILWRELIEQKHLKTMFLLLQSNISQEFYKDKDTTLRQHLCSTMSFFDILGSLVLIMQNYEQNWLLFPWVTVWCSNGATNWIELWTREKVWNA